MTKKLVKMLKYTVYNLVKFAVALLRAGRGLKYLIFLLGINSFFGGGGTFYALNTQGNLCEISEKIVG